MYVEAAIEIPFRPEPNTLVEKRDGLMTLAGDVMTRDVVTATKDESVAAAMAKMREHKISGLPVIDDQGRLCGIVTALDVLKHMSRTMPWFYEVFSTGMPALDDIEPLEDKVSRLAKLRVEEVMTRRVVVVDIRTPVEDVARVLMGRAIKRVPVVQEGRVVGVVSRGDVVSLVGQHFAGDTPVAPPPESGDATDETDIKETK